MKKITIIGKEQCPFCKNAVALCVAREFKYEYLSIPEDVTLDEAFKMAKRPFSTVPFIMISDEKGNLIEEIGGFAELRAKANEVKDML